MSETTAVVRWLIALHAIGWALYPFLYLATPGLRDRGLTLMKPFTLLALVYPVWFLAALGLPVFTAPALISAGVGLSVVGWALVLRQPRAPQRSGESSPWARGTRPNVGGQREALTFFRSSWSYILATEILFTGAFLFYVWLRGFNPEIVGTEKPMEIGFLSAATRETRMPPGDPWLSGHGINYYYLGYALIAAVAKLTGVSSSLAFNLGLATIFAATLTSGTGLTANLLARAWETNSAREPRPRPRILGAGLIGGYLLTLAGNMYAARDILSRGREAIDAWWWGGLGWKSSRVIVDHNFPARIWGSNAPPSETINEFPFFSFILGDLHAHVLALPFTVLALALSLDALIVSPLAARHEARGTGQGSLGGDEVRTTTGAAPTVGFASSLSSFAHYRTHLRLVPLLGLYRIAVAALVVGGLYALNSWDLPTYAVIYGAALLMRPLLQGRWRTAQLWIALALFGALSLAFYAPFYVNFTSLVGGQRFDLPEPLGSIPVVAPLLRTIGLVIWSKTGIDEFFTIYLLPWTVALIYLAWRWKRDRAAGADWQTPVLTTLGLALAATLLQMPVFFLAGVLLALVFAILRRDSSRDADTFATTLFGSAFALVLLTEFVFVHDVFGNRMNTVFKVYYQAWTLLAIAAGYAVVRAVFDLRRWRSDGGWRVPAAALMTLLLIASTAYPIYGSAARTEQFAERKPIDGLEFARAALPEEYAAIRWVRDNIPASAVVTEAPGCSYGELYGLPHNRVSAFAGVSTPLGWGGHEQQWRGSSAELLAALGPRGADVNTLYSTTNTAQAAQILDRYGIDYVYVGVFERQGYSRGGIGADCRAGGAYPAAGLAKFGQMMNKVYESDGGMVVIYRRR